MCNNSLIYMINTGSSTVLAGGIVPLTTIARRRGRLLQSTGDSITLNAPGYYRVSATVTFTAPVAGNISLAIQKNGVTVPGLTGASTITTATTEIEQITINGIVRVTCSDGASVLTLVNTGLAITTSNVSFDVEYLD